MNKKHVDGGICARLGFTASGVAADINGKGNSKKDVALIFSEVPAIAAGVFTVGAAGELLVILTEDVAVQPTLSVTVTV